MDKQNDLQSDGPTSIADLAEVSRLIDGDRYMEALAIIDRIIQDEPKSAQPWLLRGKIKNKQSDIEAALRDFTKVVELDPRNVLGHHYRGVALRLSGQHMLAEREYREAVRLAPDESEYHLVLADVLFDLDRTDEAISEAVRGLELETDKNAKAKYYNRFGERLRECGRGEEALVQYQEAVKLAPDEPDYHQHLADVLFDLDRTEEAIAYTETLENAGTQAAYRDRLGERLRERGRGEEALVQYQEAVKLAPDESGYHLVLADVLFDLGRTEEAISEAVRGLELETDKNAKVWIHDRFGERLRERGRSEEALVQYQEAVKLAPDEPDYHQHLADVLFDLDRTEEAIAYTETLENTGTQAAYRDRLGERLRERGRSEEALVQYQEAVKLVPDEPDYHQHLADVLFDLDRTEEALREYQMLRGPLSLTRYARALSLLGRHKEAHTIYRRALAEASKDELVEVVARTSEYLIQQRNIEAAIRLHKSEISKKDYPEFSLRLNLARLYSDRLGRYDDALQELQLAARCRPLSGEPAARVGQVLLYGLGRAGEAIDAFDRAASSSESGRMDRELSLADALARAGQWDRAIEIFQGAVGTTLESRARFLRGNALIDERRYGEAVDQYSKCPRLPRDYFYISCRHNLAWTLERQYEYAEARQEWEKVLQLYQILVRQQQMQDTPADEVSGTYTFMATISSNLERYHDAAYFMEQALAYDPISVMTLATAVTIYVEMRDRGQLQRHNAHWHARESCKRAHTLVQDHSTRSPGAKRTIEEQVLVAEALLLLDDHVAAQDLLQGAARYAKNDSYLELMMGVLYAAQQDYPKAEKRFRRAVSLDPTDLKAQTYLAESLLKLGHWRGAEEVYRQVLQVSNRHVETLLGLGEVYTAMGDAGEEPEVNYTRAIDYFTRAIDTSDSHYGSKVLNKKEKSSALYSRGYARAKLFESAGPTARNSYLSLSLQDFRDSKNLDKERDKAEFAAQRAEERLREAAADRVPQRIGPILVGSLGLVIFILAQVSFFAGAPLHKISPSYHAMLTFGSLIFIIASLYLPNLLRIKLAGVELEKKPVEQIGASKPLGIKR